MIFVYEIIFTAKAKKQFGKFNKTIQQRIDNSLKRIRIRPEAYITRLVGEQIYKFRIGDYRILMDIDNGKLIILIIKIAHRKEVYKF